MKHFDSTMDKYNHLFEGAISILINFLHKCHINSTYEIIGNQVDDPVDYDQDANFQKFNTFLTFALNYAFVRTLRSLATFKFPQLKLFIYDNLHIFLD